MKPKKRHTSIPYFLILKSRMKEEDSPFSYPSSKKLRNIGVLSITMLDFCIQNYFMEDSWHSKICKKVQPNLYLVKDSFLPLKRGMRKEVIEEVRG